MNVLIEVFLYRCQTTGMILQTLQHYFIIIKFDVPNPETNTWENCETDALSL